MLLWLSTLIDMAKCGALKAQTDSNPPAGENAALHAFTRNDHGAVVYALKRLRERRLRGWMTCTRVVLKRDRCGRMISAGPGGRSGVAWRSSLV